MRFMGRPVFGGQSHEAFIVRYPACIRVPLRECMFNGLCRAGSSAFWRRRLTGFATLKFSPGGTIHLMVGRAGGIDGLFPILLGGVHSVEAYPTEAVGTIGGLFPDGGRLTRGGILADRKE